LEEEEALRPVQDYINAVKPRATVFWFFIYKTVFYNKNKPEMEYLILPGLGGHVHTYLPQADYAEVSENELL